MPFAELGDDFAEAPRLGGVVSAPVEGLARPTEDDIINDGGFVLLREAHLDSSFSLVECEELELVDCVLDGVSLSAVEAVRVSGSRLASCDFSGVSFVGVRSTHFDSCRFVGSQFGGALLRDVTFESSVLRHVNLRMTTMERVAFRDCQLDDVDFYDADLAHVSVAGSELAEVNLDQARCDHVDLRDAKSLGLKGAPNLAGAAISEAQVMALAYHFALASGVTIDSVTIDSVNAEPGA